MFSQTPLPVRGEGKEVEVASQNQMIIAALKAGKHITDDSARELCGTYRLSGRIKELRDRGFPIGDVWREGVARTGRPMRYKEYFWVGEVS